LPEVIVDAEAAIRGKPHPEGYLKAAGSSPSPWRLLDETLKPS
jgi:beta-phosphoglucomutase-like phosphatase (HAD superfamily)